MKPCTRRGPNIGKKTLESCDVQYFDNQVNAVAGAHMKESKLWIEKTNDLVDIETDISRNLKGLVAIEIATAVSLAAVAIAIWFFETQPRRERELDR